MHYHQSPPSPTSTTSSQLSFRSINDWIVEDVVDFFYRVGCENYCDIVQQAGIDGPTLSFLDHESLKDLGILSVGHRLRILRAIYDLKQRDGIALEEGDWSPPGLSILGVISILTWHKHAVQDLLLSRLAHQNMEEPHTAPIVGLSPSLWCCPYTILTR